MNWKWRTEPNGVVVYIRLDGSTKEVGPSVFDTLPQPGHLVRLNVTRGKSVTEELRPVIGIEHRPDPISAGRFVTVVILGEMPTPTLEPDAS